MSETKTYPLRLPRSLKKAVEQQSREDGTSINQFAATAVAEKLSALQTAEFFASRRARADFKAFDKLMGRRGGKRPVPVMSCHPPLKTNKKSRSRTFPRYGRGRIRHFRPSGSSRLAGTSHHRRSEGRLLSEMDGAPASPSGSARGPRSTNANRCSKASHQPIPCRV